MTGFGIVARQSHYSGHHWQGVSGRWYLFGAMPLNSVLANEPSIYVIASRGSSGYVQAIYIGETQDVRQRIGAHAASGLLDRAARLGANELHVLPGVSDLRVRLDIETDLRNGHDAPLNRQPSAATNFRHGSARGRAGVGLLGPIGESMGSLLGTPTSVLLEGHAPLGIGFKAAQRRPVD